MNAYIKLSWGGGPFLTLLPGNFNVGLTWAPPAGGELPERKALPTHHPTGQLAPTGQEEGNVWAAASWPALSKCWRKQGKAARG